MINTSSRCIVTLFFSCCLCRKLTTSHPSPGPQDPRIYTNQRSRTGTALCTLTWYWHVSVHEIMVTMGPMAFKKVLKPLYKARGCFCCIKTRLSHFVIQRFLSSYIRSVKSRETLRDIERYCEVDGRKHLIIGHESVISLQCYCMRLRDLDSHGQICWFYAGDFLSFSSQALQRMHRCSCFS